MFTNHVYGIDLGSNMIKIYSQKNDVIVKERNMIAIRNKEDILAVGDEAYEMFEKNPDNVEVTSPMSNGMIANISYLEIVLHMLLEKTGRRIGRRPVFYFAVPVDTTEIEKRAYYSVAQSGRFRKSRVLLVEKPIADALALGIPIIKTKGSMIVNIGAATTEISVIADSRVIISKIVPMGGDHFNQAILNNIRRRNNFFVSLRTAGRLKMSLADLKQKQKLARKIVGVDCVSGLPRERVVTSGTINESMNDAISEIASQIRTFLERTPPQIHRVILAEGIYLTGGSTKIPNIDRILSEQIGCPIILSQYYDLCTVYGLKEIITHDALHHWAFTPKKRK
ncbi:MAG: rod shape-determining protein [Clostridia bacterium]|nr:rod shape-determining protein [Clostridia bacterium]NCC43383.1 rod shape-determining protein [Clostridia bacterium]